MKKVSLGAIMPDTEYFSTRSFHDTRITVIDEGTGWYRAELLDEEQASVDPFGKEHPDGLPISFLVAHVRTPNASILIDAGFDDPDSEWGRKFAREWLVHRTMGLTRALAAIGESRESITHVIITHAHFDHVAGLTIDNDGGRLQPRFQNAPVYVHEADGDPTRTHLADSASSDISRRLEVIHAHGLLRPVKDGHIVADGVTMIHTGGESPGHCVVRVDTTEAVPFLSLGDLFHYSFEFEHPDWMVPWSDRQATYNARASIMQLAADSGATCIFSHNPFPAWGKIVRKEHHYHWQALDPTA